MNSVLPISIGGICKTLVVPAVGSISSMLWSIITYLWPWQWLIIIGILTVWVVFEVATRNGRAHFNSENGFSPMFNRFVGSGSHLLIQGILLLVFQIFFGDYVYCNPLSYITHVLAFFATGGLLVWSGFWVYWRLPNGKKIRFK